MSQAAFRLGVTAEDQASELMEYATKELGAKTFVLLYPASSSGDELGTAFRNEAYLKGGVVVGEYRYNIAYEDKLQEAIEQFETRQPDAVFIGDSLENTWTVLQLINNTSLRKSLLLGPSLWDDPIALRGYGSLLDGAYYVTPFFHQSNRPNVTEFVRNYYDRFHSSPELLSAQAYDAAVLAFMVLSQVNTGDREGIISKLRITTIPNGVTGALSVNRFGDIQRRMSVVRLVRGESVEVMAGGVVTGYVFGEESLSQN
jgi:branched-chain amino acid transport system substrate-binding protein